MKFKCERIYTENGCINGVLEIEGCKIKNIILNGNAEDAIECKCYRILPGFIDIHTHGYLNCTAQATTKEELMSLCENMAKIGVTSFLPTAGEHFPDEMENLRLLADMIENYEKGARMLGIHMEGPFINPKKLGSFTLDQLLPISLEKMEQYIEASRNHIVYITIAPELDEDGNFISYLKSKNIIVAGGHTNATYEQYRKAIEFGLKASTHTGNAMKQIMQRDVGALGAALLDDSIYCEIICDLFHLSKEMIEIMLRIKDDSIHKMIMVSDSGKLAGNPPGIYFKYGQKRIIDEAGHILLEDGTIAGSSQNVLYGVKNLEERLNLNMEDIVLMASMNPAKLLGIDNNKGSLKCGKDADFIIMNDEYQIISTYVEGKCVYRVGEN